MSGVMVVMVVMVVEFLYEMWMNDCSGCFHRNRFRNRQVVLCFEKIQTLFSPKTFIENGALLIRNC